jgi:hypothetical protein
MTKFSRRGAIGVGAAGIVGLKTGIASAQTAPTTLRAVVSYAGKTYEYAEATGKDLGDFVSTIGNFTQRCVRSEISDLPLSVFFRPDRNTDRVEVVFELGRIFSATPANMGPYSVTIYRGTQTLTRIDVTTHYWFSRWRWQSSPRPVVGDVAKLVEQNLIPAYDRSAAPQPTAPTLNVMPLPNGDYLDVNILAQFSLGNYANASKLVLTAQQYAALNSSTASGATVSTSSSIYAVMGLAGVTAYMPNTGERSDIGLVTEPQAKFICTADQASLDLLRAQAEAAGTIPWHMRDETQTGPFDFRKYPNASWYWSTNGGTPHVKTSETPITVDSAHQPALAYVPYLLTGDPYHLEDLQFQATWNWGALPAQYRPSIPQARAFAWSLRTLAQAARITPATTPSWLLPQSYWMAQLSTTRGWFEDNYVESFRPERALFRATANIDVGRGETGAPEGTWVDPWQDEFVAAVLGWVVTMGFSDWRTAFDWSIGGTVARTSTTSGWVRAFSTPYRMILRATKTSPFANSWSEAWALQQSVGKAVAADPNTWATDDMASLTFTRGALFYAVKLGTPGATENLAWATAQLKTRKWNTAYKWRLGLGL